MGDTGDGTTSPATLRWSGLDALPPERREALAGPGAVFETRVEPVCGVPVEVFVRRPPHLRAVLESSAARCRDTPYLVFPDETVSFAGTLQRVGGIAERLAGDFGIGAGDRVAVASANSLGYALTYWAVLSLGAVAVGLNGWWAAPELRQGIELTSPQLVLCDDDRRRRLAAAGTSVAPVVGLDDVVAGAPTAALPDAPIHEDDPAVLLFTSGTTGRPKAAMLSHRNLIHFGLAPAFAGAVSLLADNSGERPPGRPVSICGSPLFHISGTTPLLAVGGLHGATIVFLRPGRWDETEHLRLTEQHRVTSWSLVPTQLWRLLEAPGAASYDLSSLRTIGCGGANLPPELRRLLTARLPGVQLTNGYGMTETAGGGVLGRRHDPADDPAAVGPAAPTMEIQVRDGSRRPLPEGFPGEIWIRGASVFLGYFGDPEATAAVFDDARWYRTGDVGRIVAGNLVLDSRTDDRIIRGGENVSPVEIENCLLDHPDIVDAAVVGVDDRVLGQLVKAVVVVRPGVAVTAADVQAWVGGRLAAFKVPAVVETRDELPRTVTGKVLKKLLV